MTVNHGSYKVDLSGKRARRRYPSRALPTIFSGEASSLHSSEYGIFFGASSLGDSEESYDSDSSDTCSQSMDSGSRSDSFSQSMQSGSRSDATDYERSIHSGSRSDSQEQERSMLSSSRTHSYDSEEDISHRTPNSGISRHIPARDPSSSDEYSSGSPWASGTGSSSQSDTSDDDNSLTEGYGTSQFTSELASANVSTIRESDDDELDTALDSVLSEASPPALSRSTTGTLKENPIVIESESPGDVSLGKRASLTNDDTKSISLDDNIDTFMDTKGIKTHEQKDERKTLSSPPDIKKGRKYRAGQTNPLPLLKNVDYGPGIEIASTTPDLSTVQFLTREETFEAFHMRVPKELEVRPESLHDDLSSIDIRSLRDRIKDKRRRKRKARRVTMANNDEELGMGYTITTVMKDQHSTDAKKQLELEHAFIVCGGRSELELCFFVLITISLFTLIILIAILVAQS